MNGTRKEQIQIAATGILLLIFVVNMFVTKKKMEKLNLFGGSGYAVAGINVGELRKKFREYETRAISYDGKPYRDPMKKPLEVTMIEGKGAVAKPVLDLNQKKDEGVKIVGGKAVQTKTEAEKQLQGIIWGKGAKNYAIISGYVVAEGEMIGSAKVITIGEGKVVLEQDGKKIEMKR